MLEAIPKEVAPMPTVIQNVSFRKISQKEYDYVVSIEDPWSTTRKRDSCMLCSKNVDNNLVMTLCCLSLVCVQCCYHHFDGSNFECPYCNINFAAFDAKQVLLLPAAAENPQTAEAAKRYISEWRKLLYATKQRLLNPSSNQSTYP